MPDKHTFAGGHNSSLCKPQVSGSDADRFAADYYGDGAQNLSDLDAEGITRQSHSADPIMDAFGISGEPPEVFGAIGTVVANPGDSVSFGVGGEMIIKGGDSNG